MRGRNKKKMQGMRLGQTIVAERERAESESERMQARKRVKRKQRTSVVIVVLMLAVFGLIIYSGMKEMSEEYAAREGVIGNYKITAEIVDEDNRGQISMRVKEYVAQLEQDFRDLGYRVVKVVLPTGTSRELYVDLDGRNEYFKVNIDRDAAVSAEDAKRMIRYLDERDLHPEYVDVRVEGKAYYK